MDEHDIVERLCPDCKGGGVNWNDMGCTCTHPNAPTIADLLRWGENHLNAADTVQDNPYRFRFKVIVTDERGGLFHWHLVHLLLNGYRCGEWTFHAEDEAREHARLIVAALRNVEVEQ